MALYGLPFLRIAMLFGSRLLRSFGKHPRIEWLVAADGAVQVFLTSTKILG